MHIIFTSIYDELPDKLQRGLRLHVQFTCFTGKKVQILTPDKLQRGLRLHVLHIEATDEINEHNACSAFSVSICTFVLAKQGN